MLRKFIASLFVLLFLFVLPFSALFFAVKGSILDRTLLTEDVVPASYDVVLPWLAEGIAEEGIANGLTGVTDGDAAKVTEGLRDVFPKETYENVLRDFIDNLFESKPQFENGILSVPLGNLREVMFASIKTIIEGIPECAGEEPLVVNDGLPTCLPGGDEREILINRLEINWKRSADSAIPETFEIDLSGDERTVPRFVVEKLFFSSSVLILLIVIPLLLLAAAVLIIWRPWIHMARYAGHALLLGGLEILGIGLSLQSAPGLIEAGVSQSTGQFIGLLLLAPGMYLIKLGSLLAIIAVGLYIACFIFIKKSQGLCAQTLKN